MKHKIFTFGIILFGAFISIVAAWHYIAQYSYDKPRKSPITPELKRKFHPLLFEPEPNFIKRFLTKLKIL